MKSIVNRPTEDRIEPTMEVPPMVNTDLRDKFAMAALTGIISKGTGYEDRIFERVAERAYLYADSMLEERRARRNLPE